MAAIDPQSSPPDAAPANVTPPAPTARDEPVSVESGRLLVLALVAGIAAAVASGVAGEMILHRYWADLNPALQIQPSPEVMQRWRNARVYSATLSFATMGGVFGLAMGLAGGLARRSIAASASAAIFGLVVGTASAACAAFLLVSNFFKSHDPQSGDLLFPMLTHGAIWVVVGVIGALIFALGFGGRGRWPASVLGGLLGAAAATIVYEIIGALFFASDKTDLPLSASVITRGMAHALVAILSAVGVVLALRQFAKSPGSSSLPI
jgi:hypothetical protein